MSGTLVILRHGQSTWNELNLFTGWHDVPLTDKGCREATQAGLTMREAGLVFDTSHTSLLERAVMTSNLALAAMHQMWLPVNRSWLLNERHYGALQGLNKLTTSELHGAQQTKVWRRSYDIAPPPVTTDSPEHPINDLRYRHIAPSHLPAAECLKDVVNRVLPYWHEVVVPQLRQNLTVLITAHGNSLRALTMYLEDISQTDISTLNIPTGVPKQYTFDDALQVTGAQYLGDAETIAAAAIAVARQAGE